MTCTDIVVDVRLSFERPANANGHCRTESVVEKLLTNWLSMCMYGYMRTHAAKAMFMLYKAIKHQTEKGPIDAVTSEARYSLSEDRLLREKMESKALVCANMTSSLFQATFV